MLIPTIVGRRHELALALHHYEAARLGRTNVVLVSGEPGIGKTRFLDEIARYAALNGAKVLRGGSSESEAMPPFLPILEAVGYYLQHAPLDQLYEHESSIWPLLATLLPEVTIRLGVQSKPAFLPAEQARFRFYEAVGTLLASIGSAHALILVLDDLQWADSTSLDLLCHILRRYGYANILLLGAYRNSEIDQSPALARTIAELLHQRVLTTIELGPLSAGEIDALGECELGASLTPAASLNLFKQSEGNPFYAEELLHSWIEGGVLVQEDQRWSIVEALAERAVPPGIMMTIRQRLMRLSPVCLDHLHVAALIGRTFDLSLLASVQDQASEAVEEYILEAMRAQLIRMDQAEHFTFSHDKIRECLYAEISVSRRHRLHGAIGCVLEARYGAKETMSLPQIAELASHFVGGRDLVRGIEYTQLAASAALRAYAAEEAMSYYQSALNLLPPADQRRGNLLLGLGEAALLAGKDEEAAIAYKTAQCFFTETEEPEVAARAFHGWGRALARQDERAQAKAAFEHALELSCGSQSVEVVEVLLDLSVLLIIYMGQQQLGMTYAQQALSMAQQLGDLRLEAIARRVAIGDLSLHGEDLAAAVQFLAQALPQVEQSGDLVEVGEFYLYLSGALYWLGEICRSYTVGVQRVRLLERSQQPYQLRTAYTWLVLLFSMQGKWSDAERMLEKAACAVDHLSSPMPAAFLHQFRGFLAYQREDYQAAERELLHAQVEQNWQMGLGEMMYYLGLLGLVQATMGKHEEARAYRARVEMQLELLPAGMLPTAPLLVCLALTDLMLGEHEHVVRLYARLLDFRGQCYWFLVDRVLGLLAIQRGDWDAATTHFAEAEATARRENLLPELAHTLCGQALLEMVRVSQGSVHRSGTLLKCAHAIYSDLGITTSVQQLQARLYSSTTLSSQALPANLTSREVEVLKLVAQGKSNFQIALLLGLTAKTVTNHLTHIFNKTNCENRAAATAFAFQHGLV
ncbi:MAG: hypothetical protein NVSMB44_34320 [Ktedonobacteraceae bacterium]